MCLIFRVLQEAQRAMKVQKKENEEKTKAESSNKPKVKAAPVVNIFPLFDFLENN